MFLDISPVSQTFLPHLWQIEFSAKVAWANNAALTPCKQRKLNVGSRLKLEFYSFAQQSYSTSHEQRKTTLGAILPIPKLKRAFLLGHIVKLQKLLSEAGT